VNLLGETIVALATPKGVGGVSIVRLSGVKAYDYALALSTLNCLLPNQILFSKFVINNSLVDEGLISYFKAPCSYTGEDVVEFNCHGGIVISDQLIDGLLGLGARMARAGEFTMRAVMNGKKDLAQAEAVINLVEAKTDKASMQSLKNLSGSLTNKIKGLRNNLLDVISGLEVYLDYPDELESGFDDGSVETLQRLSVECDGLLANYYQGRLLQTGVKLVIVGAPNVGKSSLLNFLLDSERAIVSSEAGTTRDTIEEWIRIDGIAVCIIDTAGIREPAGLVEGFGITRSRESLKNADLILYVRVEGADDLLPSDAEDLFSAGIPIITVINKIDLVSPEDTQLANTCLVSVKNSNGMGFFMDVLQQKLNDMVSVDNDDVVLSNDRQKEQLIKANDSLKKSLDSVNAGYSEDLWLIDLRQALLDLGEITGDGVSEDVLSRVFSRFCVGK
jgi:tRNA modification GTPase